MGEITVAADRYQTKRLVEWASRLDGDGRLWAVEAAGGLGYLLSQQLVACGEPVVDVPAVLASRVRVLGSGKSERTTPTMPGRWRSQRCVTPVWLPCDEIVVTAPGARAIRETLPEAVAFAVIDFITGPLLDNPRRVGAAHP